MLHVFLLTVVLLAGGEACSPDVVCLKTPWNKINIYPRKPFTLSGNSVTDSVSVKVLVATDSGIYLYDTAMGKRYTVYETSTAIFSVDFHYDQQLIFFYTNRQIFRGDLDLRNKVVKVESIVKWDYFDPVRITVDYQADKIYWISDLMQSVGVADLDGSNRRVVADNVPGMAYPNNLVVDPIARVLFFVSNDVIYKIELLNYSVSRVDIDWSDSGKEGRGVRSLALDRTTRTLYFSGRGKEDPETNRTSLYVARASYDGSDLEEIELGGDNPSLWNDIYSMDVWKSRIFYASTQGSRDCSNSLWTQENSERSNDVQKFTTAEVLPLSCENIEDIWAIKVYHPLAQPRPVTSTATAAPPGLHDIQSYLKQIKNV